MPRSRARKFGSLRGELSGIKDKGDFWLTRFPALYLALERHREWVNWDKRIYLALIRPGEVVLDVGANRGDHAIFFSHLVGRRGQVVAYEPVPENLVAMRAQIARRARFANVMVVPSAVGAPGGVDSAVICVPGSDLTQASLQPQSAGSWTGEPDVRSLHCAITSLDADATVRSLAHLDFMKIDVEGGELDVLKGGAATISLHRPIIYCEVYEKWTRAFGYSPSDLFEFVRSLGYRQARVIADGAVHAHDLDSTAPESWFARSSDVLFFLDEHRPLLRRFDRRYLASTAG